MQSFIASSIATNIKILDLSFMNLSSDHANYMSTVINDFNGFP